MINVAKDKKPAGRVGKVHPLPDKRIDTSRVGDRWESTKRIDSDESRPHGSAHKRGFPHPDHPNAGAPSRFQALNKGDKWQPHKFMGDPAVNAAAQNSAGKKHKPLSKRTQLDSVLPDMLDGATPDQQDIERNER